MTDDLRPALTAAEWIQYGNDLEVMADWAADKRPFGPDRRYTMEEKRHAVAAIALHHHPFGFTHDEARILEEQAKFYDHRAFAGDVDLAAKIRRIAAKISALLPPKEAEIVLGKLAE